MSRPETLPTPQQMVAHLDRFVRGQARAKRDLALAFHDHYLGLAASERPELCGPVARTRQHVLVLGPTGSGKTLLVRTLCEWLGVPVAFWSATAITETGYVGDDVDEPLKHLWRDAKGDTGRVHRGVVVLDEVDKIRIVRDHGRDVSGEGVQNGLLTLLDGRTVHLRDKQDALGTVDTSKLLFVCMGAFVELPKLVRQRRRGEAALGFAEAPAAREPRLSDDDAIAAASTDDLVRYGLLPEFVGRFPNLTAVRALSEDDLVALLRESEGSPLERERQLWALHGVELDVEEDALRALAEQARARGTGARGLAFALRRSLAPLAWERDAWAADGVERVTLDRAALLHGGPPRLQRTDALRDASVVEVLREVALGREGRRSRVATPSAPVRPRRRRADEQQTRLGLPGDPPASETVSAAPTAEAPPPAGAKRLAHLRLHVLRWGQAKAPAREWWLRFEERRPLEVVLQVAEDLASRKATIQEFWETCRDSGTVGIRANLRWLDFVRERRAFQHACELRGLLEARDRRDAREGGEHPPEPVLAAIDAESFPEPAQDPAA